MPGAASTRRERSSPKLSTSSAGNRNIRQQQQQQQQEKRKDNVDNDVIVYGYTSVNSELPQPSVSKDRPQGKNISATRSASDRRAVRFLQMENIGHRSRRSTSPGLPSTSSSSSHDKNYTTTDRRSTSVPRQPPMPHGGFSSSSGVSSSSSSPESNIRVDEDEVTCAICLDILRRPRSLPCGHTFCLICLQNYVNSCRTMFTCPSCRGSAQVPQEGVVGLPANIHLAKCSQLIRQRRLQEGNALACHGCGGRVGVMECGHCKRAYCTSCGDTHAEQIRAALTELKDRLAAAKDTLYCRVEEDETRFNKLEENISETVEERVAKLHLDCKKLKQEVQELRKESQQRSEKLAQDIENILSSSSPSSSSSSLPVNSNTQPEWVSAGALHANLTKLLKAASSAKGPRVTLDETSLTISTSMTLSPADPIEVKDEEEDERHFIPENHSLHYRSKGSLARLRWGQHLGERPAGAAVSPWTSEILVTGSDTCRIFVFDGSGRQISSFGSRGHADGQFLCPVGLAFSHVSKEVFITDKWKHCIHVFDTEGNFIRQLGRKGKGFGHFSSPEGIATDCQGRIYVADTCNHRVQVLDSDGVFLREVGVVSSETLRDGHRYTKSEFNEPTGVAASLNGSRVYVADAGNHRVKVFDGTTGERVLMFGSRGRNKGQFESPECIAVDTEGFILVGDSGNGRVQVFRPNGHFVRYLGSKGNNNHGEFGWVSGLALSKSLDVVVTDFKNNLVAVF